MFMGEIDGLSSQEPEFSEKEDDEWILVDFIGKVLVRCELWPILVVFPCGETIQSAETW